MRPHRMPVAIVAYGIVLSLLVAAAPSSAGENEDSAVHHFLGAWEGQGTLFGVDAAFRMQWDWTLGGRFAHLTFENRMTGPDGAERVMQAQAFFRPVAEEAGRWEGTWFDSRGMVLPLTATVDATTWTTLWGSPETEQGRTVYRFVEGGQVEVEDFVLKEEEWHPFGRATYERAPVAGS